MTERTKLSGATLEFIGELSKALKEDFEIFVESIISTVIKLFGRSNAVFVKRAQTCIKKVIEATNIVIILRVLLENMKSKSKGIRNCCSDYICQLFSKFEKAQLNPYVKDLELFIREGSVDPEVLVRSNSSKSFKVYTMMFSERKERYINR